MDAEGALLQLSGSSCHLVCIIYPDYSQGCFQTWVRKLLRILCRTSQNHSTCRRNKSTKASYLAVISWFWSWITYTVCCCVSALSRMWWIFGIWEFHSCSSNFWHPPSHPAAQLQTTWGSCLYHHYNQAIKDVMCVSMFACIEWLFLSAVLHPPAPQDVAMWRRADLQRMLPEMHQHPRTQSWHLLPLLSSFLCCHVSVTWKLPSS